MSARHAVERGQDEQPQCMDRLWALDAVLRSLVELTYIARVTDAPEWQGVDASDLLDAATRAQTQGASS